MPWLTGWGYRKSHAIAGSTVGQQTNYQVKVVAHKGAGVDSGVDVYLGANVRDDFGDVRFTDSDGQTPLDYWMESLTAGSQAVFWVEVPTIPVSPGSATIYIYYGKSDETTTSNAPNTFIVGEVFPDASHWTPILGSWSLVAGDYKGVKVGASPPYRNSSLSDYSPPANMRILSRLKSSVDNSLANLVFRAATNGNDDNDRIWVRLDQRAPIASHEGGFHLYEDVTGAESCKGSYDFAPIVNQYYHAEILAYGTSIKGILDGVLRWTAVVTRTAAGYLLVQVEYLAGHDAFFDYICIGKYVDPEPAHGAWGSEETPPPPGPPPVGPPKIELRLTSVDPPAPDPPRTIYRDLVNLPDPVVLGLTIRYFNYDDVTLYFRITGSCAGYTFGSVDLGSLASGLSAYRNLDNFASRAKPAAELTESIKLTLRAYTDAAYSNLKWTYERTVSVVWIDSSDPSYTLDELDNFDDGTVQGWTAANELNNDVGYPTIGVTTDYALSAPYSLIVTSSSIISAEIRSRLYKSFTTPNRSVVYAIIDVRLSLGTPADTCNRNLQVQRDSTLLVFLGKPYQALWEQCIPLNKWMRIVVPLPKNTTLEVRVVFSVYTATNARRYYYLYMDDFKIISK